ncbi:hypothetical protein [Priestia koreensis]|uniref:hypothetical protein n=1 Tax=Priestia koreensis TaxID=284581 RepID=UPI001F57FBBA|nr:hypothetical protein [Priestia koreensis]UNL87467.1 hypothetical protein IE339_24430 [Priestia koreensis]
MKLVGFYADSSNVGKRTVSQALAKVAAEHKYKTLYVELDYLRPSFYTTTGITHTYKNAFMYLDKVINKGQFEVEPNILTRDEIDISNKILSDQIRRLPGSLDYLVFHNEYIVENFPSIEDRKDPAIYAKELCEKFAQHLRFLSYDLVVISLPTPIDNMFTLPMMLQLDHVVHLVTPNLTRIREFQNSEQILANLTNQDHIRVLNMLPQGMEEEIFSDQLPNLDLAISYDEKLLPEQLELKIGSEKIDREVIKLLNRMDVHIADAKKSKRIFSLR